MAQSVRIPTATMSPSEIRQALSRLADGPTVVEVDPFEAGTPEAEAITSAIDAHRDLFVVAYAPNGVPLENRGAHPWILTVRPVNLDPDCFRGTSMAAPRGWSIYVGDLEALP